MNENLEDLKQQADKLDSDGSWDELIPLCTRIIDLEQEPREKASAYVKRGSAYNHRGNHDLAIADCTMAIELNSFHANAYITRGIAYDKKGDHDKAIADYTKSLELEPNNMFAYHNRGIAYINKNDHDKALEDFNKILERDPANAEIHLFCGFAYSLKGEHDKAIEDFTRALELDPNYANAYLCQGIAYIEQENFLAAFKDFKKAAECDPVLKAEVSEIYVAEQIADIYKDRAQEEGARAFELYFRLLEAISNVQKKLFYAPQQNAEVAHYTCLDTLKSLADRECFRLYNTFYMNDPEEGREFFKIMQKSGIDVRDIFYGDEAQSNPSPAFIGSFVKVAAKDPKRKDELLWWRLYGKHDGKEAAGACLIFKHEGTVFAENCGLQIGAMQQLQLKLLTSAGDTSNPGERRPPKPDLYEIVYRDKENYQELSEELNEVAESLEQIKSYISEKDDCIKDKLKQLVRDLLDAIRFLFKSHHYKEEGEVRVGQVRYYDKTKMTQDSNNIKVDKAQTPPRFYLETHENFRFSEVILGPQARGVPELIPWLKERGIKAEQSNIPYGKPYP
ncbi:MAG: tetratricopeptide repeat protein [Nitrospira sp.]|nr:tetratricopeptide repeat protein [Nitrospira sp.]